MNIGSRLSKLKQDLAIYKLAGLPVAKQWVND